MNRSRDPLARARQAVRQVDGELDLDRVRPGVFARMHTPGEGDEAGTHDAGSVSFEIVRGDGPRTPVRRARVAWALAASVLLLAGAGLGTAALWPDPATTIPAGPVPASPGPATKDAPSPSQEEPDIFGGATPSPAPRECAPSAPARPTPEPAHESVDPSTAPASETC